MIKSGDISIEYDFEQAALGILGISKLPYTTQITEIDTGISLSSSFGFDIQVLRYNILENY